MSTNEDENELNGNIKKVDILKNTETEVILCSVWVEKFNKRGKKNKRLFVASEGSLSLYKHRPFTKDLSISRKFSWFDLLKISVTDSPNNQNQTSIDTATTGNIVELFFQNDSITFEHQSALKISTLLGKYAVTILCLNERPQITVPFFDPVIYSEEPEPLLYCGKDDSTEYAALMRFRSTMFFSGAPIPQTALQCFIDYVRKSTFEFDCTPLGTDFHAIQKWLFFSLQIDDSIESIVTPKCESQGGNWIPICAYTEQSRSLRSITTGEQFNETAGRLIDAVKNNKRCCLKDMTLVKNNIKDSQLLLLINILKVLKLDSLSLHSAMTRRVLKLFLIDAETTEFFQNLRSFTIDGIQGLTVLTAMQVCKNIPHVSCTNCESEVASFIKSLLKVVSCKIETLDISGNQSYVVIKERSSFPASLHHLTVDNCKFAIPNIPLFMRVVCNTKHDFCLSMNHIIVVSDKWDTVFDRFEQLSSPTFLTELHWDSNRISGKFLDFLERARRLKFLTINNLKMPKLTDDSKSDEGSSENEKEEQTKNIIEDLSDFIATNDSLESLSLNSTKQSTKMTPNMLMHVIAALGENRWLNSFSIQGHDLKGQVVDQLSASLMNNRVLNVLDIRNCIVDDNDLIMLFRRIENRGAPINILFNESDIKDEILRSEFGVLKSKAYKGDEKIDIPSECLTAQNYNRIPKYRTTEKTIRHHEQSPRVKEESSPQSQQSSEDESDEESACDEQSDPPALSASIFGQIPPPPPSDLLINQLEKRFSINEIVSRIRQSDKK